MRSFLVATAACCVFLVNSASAQQDVRSILRKAIKAQGGEKAKRLKAYTANAKGYMQALGMKMNYKAKYTWMAPDKFRFDLKMKSGDKEIEIIAASDGKTAWEQSGAMLRTMAKKKAAEFDHNVYTSYVARIFPLTGKSFKVTPLGESKEDGKTLIGIKVAKKGKRDVKLYFDKETYRLYKSESRIIDEFTNKEAKQEAYFTKYRKTKNGHLVFGLLTIKKDGKPFIVEEYSNQRSMERVDPKLFAKPAPSDS